MQSFGLSAVRIKQVYCDTNLHQNVIIEFRYFRMFEVAFLTLHLIALHYLVPKSFLCNKILPMKATTMLEWPCVKLR